VFHHAHPHAPSAHSFAPSSLAAANCAPMAATLGPRSIVLRFRRPSEERRKDRCILPGR
jgi:hypothetical protein